MTPKHVKNEGISIIEISKSERLRTGTSIHPRRYFKSAAKVITNIYTDEWQYHWLFRTHRR